MLREVCQVQVALARVDWRSRWVPRVGAEVVEAVAADIGAPTGVRQRGVPRLQVESGAGPPAAIELEQCGALLVALQAEPSFEGFAEDCCPTCGRAGGRVCDLTLRLKPQTSAGLS